MSSSGSKACDLFKVLSIIRCIFPFPQACLVAIVPFSFKDFPQAFSYYLEDKVYKLAVVHLLFGEF